ncbi:MAG: hypothetical protein AAB944_01215 [Patescibacteria group bacterium]
MGKILPGSSLQKNSDYMTKQLEEMFSPLNRYFTGIAVGHNPNEEECMMHYSLNGGSDSFEKRWA